MPLDDHDEIEFKLPADGVAIDDFIAWCRGMKPDSETLIHEPSPDVYYAQGKHVVRHRFDEADTYHELAVKRRKSNVSTLDRVEVELMLAPGVKTRDVAAFMRAAGFREAEVLRKTSSIFQFTSGKHKVVVAIYDVWQEHASTGDVHAVERYNEKRFIEAESKKGSDVSVDAAKRHLKEWRDMIAERFGISGTPLNLSLYEIYSGQRYLTMEDDER